MKQILHIFIKDTRRFWPEILISLAITAFYVWACPNQWPSFYQSRNQLLSQMAGLLGTLVLISWCVLITRVIHADKLVGDTQFWLTRPYDWKKLLAAKLLFLAVFLSLPLFIAQNIILAEMGFHPQSYLTGLLFNLLLTTTITVLPIVVLATVTSSLVRMALAVLGILAGVVLWNVSYLFLSQHLGGNLFINGPSPIGNHLCYALELAAVGAAILLQYKLRRVWLTWSVLIAFYLLSGAVALIAPDRFLIDSSYPISTNQLGAPILLSYNSNPIANGMTMMRMNSMVPIDIQLETSGIPNGSVVELDRVKAEVKASDGSTWTSGWQSADRRKIFPGKGSYNGDFSMPLNVFNKFKSMPLSLHLTYAITQAQAGKVTTIPLPLRDFSIPGVGVCRLQDGSTSTVAQVACISPVRKLPLTYIKTRWPDNSCPDSLPLSDPGMDANAWLEQYPAGIGIAPLVQSNGIFYFYGSSDYSTNDKKNNNTCAFRYLNLFAPITFTQYSEVRRTQTSVTIENYRLPQLLISGKQYTVSN